MTESMNKLDMGGISPTFNTIYLGATRAGAMDGTEVTATAAEINAAAKTSNRAVIIGDVTAYTVLAADSGKIHVFPDFTATCTITLPTASLGLNYTFISKAVAADAQNVVITATPALIKGGVAFADTDAGAAADEIHAGVWPNGSSHVALTMVTPGAGTKVLAVCDGTSWILNGVVYSATVPTVA